MNSNDNFSIFLKNPAVLYQFRLDSVNHLCCLLIKLAVKLWLRASYCSVQLLFVHAEVYSMFSVLQLVNIRNPRMTTVNLSLSSSSVFFFRIEETWRLWQKFLDDYSRFEDWLKISERTAAFPSSSGVLYTVAKEELKKFEVTCDS